MILTKQGKPDPGPSLPLNDDSLELLPPGQPAGVESLKSAKPPEEEFADMADHANQLACETASVQVTDITQVEQMQLARQYRLTLRALRIKIEKKHKDLKAFYLAGGRRIDSLKNTLVPMLETEEKRLKDCEEFVEREQERLRQELHMARLEELAPWGSPVAERMNLASLSEIEFADLLHGAKLAHAAREKEAAELAAAERAKAEETARVRAENDRLRAEAEAVKQQVAAMEAAARKKAAEQAAAEAEARRAEAAAVQQAAAAPDADKMQQVVLRIDDLLVFLRSLTMAGKPGAEALTELRVRMADAHGIAERVARELMPY